MKTVRNIRTDITTGQRIVADTGGHAVPVGRFALAQLCTTAGHDAILGRAQRNQPHRRRTGDAARPVLARSGRRVRPASATLIRNHPHRAPSRCAIQVPIESGPGPPQGAGRRAGPELPTPARPAPFGDTAPAALRRCAHRCLGAGPAAPGALHPLRATAQRAMQGRMRRLRRVLFQLRLVNPIGNACRIVSQEGNRVTTRRAREFRVDEAAQDV